MLEWFVRRQSRLVRATALMWPWRQKEITIHVTLDGVTNECIRSMAEDVERIADALEEIAFWNRPLLVIGKPKILRKAQLSMSTFAYTFDLPAPVNLDDVAKRSLVVQVNGGTATESDVDKAVTVSPEFIFEAGATVSLAIKDFDAAANFAVGPALEFTVNDDVPPAVPGAPGVLTKRQL